MILSNNKISVRQLQILLILDICGAGLIDVPKIAANYGSGYAWVCVAVSTVAAAICAYILTVAANLCGNASFYEYLRKAFSTPFAIVCVVPLVIKMILSASLILNKFCGGINALHKIPIYLTTLFMLLICAYAARKNAETRGRLGETLFVAAIVPLLVAVLYALLNSGTLAPTPVPPPQDVLSGGLSELPSFYGIEFLLFCTPFVNGKKLGKPCVGAVCAVGVLFCVITYVTVCKLGYANAARLDFPVIRMANTLPTLFCGQDTAMLYFWTVTGFAAISGNLFFSNAALRGIAKRGEYVLGLCVLVFLCSRLPYNLINALAYGLNVWIYVLCLILIIFSRKLGENEI
ncbi:hypothetical protein FACS1894188_03050 [Clostridia bacterium]|nr:hypothetical protein FACS1894188_03050 [Clostridia bacterium]